ncbi:Fic family protein [uncultured Oscillibacter sp.]|uniref:Fic family protein n=1 Tax=uncultured Oscillibacter sp. TaxID=876091 RepID=UPI002804A0B5|nr:Fic family protein [uncultured Oscillibacter sp.]
MLYDELKKIYYKDQTDYAKEYERRFNSEDTVRLDFQIGDKTAFFVETAEVLRLALKITQLDKKVAKLSSTLPGVAKDQYSKKCLIDEIVLSNKIEGVHSSRKEIGEALDILERQAKNKHKHTRFLGLVNKYLKLMSENVVPLETCQDIRNIYDEVFLQEVLEEDPQNKPDGKIFRKGPESVYNDAQKIIHQGVYPEEKIIKCMDEALQFLNKSDTQELYKICIFHYLIEYIHPFYDGNGRLGRFILSYCISKTLEPLVAYRISETIKENKTAYYRAFSVCNDRLNLGDLTPFLIMQLQMIYSAMVDLQKSLTEKLIRWKRYGQLVDSLPNATDQNMKSLYHYLIQASLFSEEGIPTPELMALLEVKSHTTLKKLLDMIPKEVLIIKTKNRVKFYELQLGFLDDMLLKQEMEDIEAREKQ